MKMFKRTRGSVLAVIALATVAGTGAAQTYDSNTIKRILDRALTRQGVIDEESVIVSVYEKRLQFVDGYQTALGGGVIQELKLEDRHGTPLKLNVTAAPAGVATAAEVRDTTCAEPQMKQFVAERFTGSQDDLRYRSWRHDYGSACAVQFRRGAKTCVIAHYFYNFSSLTAQSLAPIYELGVTLSHYCSDATTVGRLLAEFEELRFATSAENHAWLANSANDPSIAYCYRVSPRSVYKKTDGACPDEDTEITEVEYRQLGGQ